MNLQQTLGGNLRAYRHQRDLSQRDMADLLDVHWSYVSAIERGTKNRTLRTIERIADGIGIDPLDLLAIAEKPRSANNGPSELR